MRQAVRGRSGWLSVLGGFLVLVLAACSPNAGQPQAEASGGAQLVVGQVAEPKSLDPGAVTAVNDFRILVNLYDGLVTYAPDSLETEPALATEWTVSEDGTEYTFTLREGVTFHDGTPLNAEAVKFNFDRMLVEGAPGSDTGPFPLAEQFYGPVAEVTAVDEHTVRFTLEEPYAPFLTNLAYPTGLIVSPAAVEEHGTDFGKHPVGTGAFTFDSWVPNQNVVLTANPDYWDGAPASETVVFRPLPEASSRLAALRSGDADLIVEVPADNVAELESDQELAVQAQAGPHLWFLILNTKEGPFADKRVRQAANYAIDKESIATGVLQGTGSVATGLIAPAFGSASDESVEGYPYDPDKARQLLAEAGHPDGVDLTFYATNSGSGMLEPQAMAAAIQSQLGEAGFRVEIQSFEWNTYLDEVNAGLAGKADMAEMAWMTNDPGTLPFLTLRTGAYPDEGGFNSGYYSNPRADELIADIQATPDPEQRNQLFSELQQLVVEDAPWVFVANGKMTAAMTSRLEGFSLHPSYVLYLKDAVLG